MKITLDHNCIIDLLHTTTTGLILRSAITASGHDFFIVDVGASEMKKYGVKPDRYDLFEELLEKADISSLVRLKPIGKWGITFWGRCLWADSDSVNLASQIEAILFGNECGIDHQTNSTVSRKLINRSCDILTLWCHIHYKNEVFLTSDKNFLKQSKVPQLLKLGAGRICKPSDL